MDKEIPNGISLSIYIRIGMLARTEGIGLTKKILLDIVRILGRMANGIFIPVSFDIIGGKYDFKYDNINCWICTVD